MKAAISAVLLCLTATNGFQISKPSSTHRATTHMASYEKDFSKFVRNGIASLVIVASGAMPFAALAADYTPASPPPVLAPQVARQAPKAAQNGAPEKWIYSKFLDQVEKDTIEKVTFSPDGKKAVAVDDDGDRYIVDIPNDPNLLSFLVQHKIEINVAPINANGGVGNANTEAAALVVPETEVDKFIQTFLVPGLLFSAITAYPVYKVAFSNPETKEKRKSKRSAGRGGGRGRGRGGGLFGGGGGPGRGRGQGGVDPEQFAKSKAKIDLTPVTGIGFKDVAGCDSAKIELEEVVDFLKNPDKYSEMGAKIPKGALLYGPPGTGKTLLAKAVAGEAGVPFISVSGSEFVQVFVGVGAARVRDMFKSANENAPCIIFIDEIDAVGRQRGGSGGGNDEREQTLNQMLTEMDGFDTNTGVIVIAATNRLDILDEALTRAGRFDRKIEVTLPDTKGRIEVLKVHARNKPLAPDIDLEQVARRTPGLSGASLKGLLNEAAIHAARNDKTLIDWDDVDWAIDRVTVGMEKTNKDAIVKDLELVAFHEAGHAIVGGLIPEYDTVAKISIVPRSNGAGGLTFFSPLDDRVDNVVTAHYLESQLAVAWGGRVAEELVFGTNRVTTGASGDLQQIFRIARAMVTQAGMSRLPPALYDFESQGEGDVDWLLSPWMKERINSEILRLASNGYFRAKKILQDNEELLWALATRLVQEDQVSQEEFHFMLYEYNATSYPYEIYGDTMVDEMPYQNSANEVAFDIFDAVPKLSSLLPQASELKNSESVSNLPQLKQKYATSEQETLQLMRRENPLKDEDWGRSRMEIVAEAKKLKAEEARKEKLLQILDQYSAEEIIALEIKKVKEQRDNAARKMLDAGVM